MSDHEESKVESTMEKISEKLHEDDSSSSSSDSDDDEKRSLKSKVYRIFGREKPVHKVFGGGKRMYFTYSYPFRFSLFLIWSKF